jgi:hypothetical protein
VVKLAPYKEPVQVLSFTLINTESELAIRTLKEGAEINLTTLPTRKLNIRANTSPEIIGSVVFKLTGPVNHNRTDNGRPYALYGALNGVSHYWDLPAGNYRLTATPYGAADAQGLAGNPLTVNFTIFRQAAAAARMVPEVKTGRPVRLQGHHLYPNPTPHGRLRVQLADKVQGSVRYRLVSAVGRHLTSGTITLVTHTDLLEFDFSSHLPATGVYYLTLEGDHGQHTLRILRE